MLSINICSGGGKESMISLKMTPMIGNGTPAAMAHVIPKVKMALERMSRRGRNNDQYEVLNGFRPSSCLIHLGGLRERSLIQ